MSHSLRPCHQQRLTHDLEIDTDQGREEASNFLACYPTMISVSQRTFRYRRGEAMELTWGYSQRECWSDDVHVHDFLQLIDCWLVGQLIIHGGVPTLNGLHVFPRAQMQV